MRATRADRLLPLGATLLIVGMFALVVTILSLRWRGDLRRGVLAREAEALEAAVSLLHKTAPVRFADFGATDETLDLFTAVLRSSELRDVILVNCFDREGNLRDALPRTARIHKLDSAFGAEALRTGALARFHEHATIESLLGPEIAAKALAPVAPLLEIIVPLRGRRDAAVVGFAHYWMDGARVREKLAAVDRGLAWQAGLIFAIGATGLATISGWALRRLSAANRRLTEQGEDLERANRELVLAAKTSAIGAISAHLIHGLKNPLDGLEGFVADAASARSAPADSEAWREAAETTRRLRTLVHDVIAVLRDEAANAGSQVGLREVIHGVLQTFACDAERNGVQLSTAAEPPDINLDNRVAHLAGLVLANLIGNAVEASPRGAHVTFAAEVKAHEIEFKVTDHGPGLPAAVRKNLFRPLSSTKPGGSGIGLAISQQLARHIGGRLELVSSSNEGTVFRFVVPQA